jgi:pantetheine-phosphate adenylyltransferase
MDCQKQKWIVDMKKLGIYPGSFDPFHTGHLDIVKQAQQVFDEIVVVRAINPDKELPMSKLPESFLNQMGISVSTHKGLVTDLVKSYENREYSVTLIRGLRSGNDLAYEQNLIAFMRQMHPYLKVVFFLCDPKHQHISSSALRGIRQFSEAEYRKYALEG